MPEIVAYKEYFSKKNFLTSETNTANEIIEKPDILWKIMGLDLTNPGIPVIHDYASLSTGLFPHFKNFIKSNFNVKPSLRLFLNEEVRSQFNFSDDIPYIIRDMGIHKSFFRQKKKVKKFDFVYLGSVSKERDTQKLLFFFSKKLRSHTLLIIGEVPNELLEIIKFSSNIYLTGRVPLNEVARLASQARYGINYMPNKYPFNIQTSTKLLEYCALGLKIITTEYEWVNNFEQKNQSSFFKLKVDLSNFEINEIENFNFITPNLEELEWNKLFDGIGLFEKINNII